MKLGAAMFFCLRLFGALVLVQGGNKVTPRIVGGSPAGNDEYPYFIRWGGCGATLIHPDIALGAAHVSGMKPMGFVGEGYECWSNLWAKVVSSLSAG